jgi:xanthine dehydrogenase accessory factor
MVSGAGPPPDSARIAEELLRARESGPPVVVATVVSGPAGGTAPGAKMLVRPDGSRLGSLDGGALDEAVAAEAREAFRRHGTETVYLSPAGKRVARQDAEPGAVYRVMLEVHERPPRLLIIGGGHIGKALAVIGNLCGFSVEVVDDREEYANAQRFPEAGRLTAGRYDEVLADYPIDGNTYVVCVTRGHKHDETSLRAVAGSPAAYVGMIGSRRRVAAVLEHIVDGGVPREAAQRVRTPVGLDIGAETPEEIAVAIMAEIIKERRGGTGAPMRQAGRRRRGVAPQERLPDGE